MCFLVSELWTCNDGTDLSKTCRNPLWLWRIRIVCLRLGEEHTAFVLDDRSSRVHFTDPLRNMTIFYLIYWPRTPQIKKQNQNIYQKKRTSLMPPKRKRVLEATNAFTELEERFDQDKLNHIIQNEDLYRQWIQTVNDSC